MQPVTSDRAPRATLRPKAVFQQRALEQADSHMPSKLNESGRVFAAEIHVQWAVGLDTKDARLWKWQGTAGAG